MYNKQGNGKRMVCFRYVDVAVPFKHCVAIQKGPVLLMTMMLNEQMGEAN